MPKVNLSDNTSAVQSFRRAIEFCTLPHVPQTTRQILSTGAWRDRFEMGRRIQFDDFLEFVTQSPAKGGCGLQSEKVTALLRKADDVEVLDMWLRAIKAKDAQEIDAQAPDLLPVGTNQYGDGGSNTEIDRTPRGTTATYAIARLRRDRPDIHDRVLAGEISPHAGMIEAGFRKKAVRKRLTSLEKQLKGLPKLTPTELRQLRARIDDLLAARPRIQAVR